MLKSFAIRRRVFIIQAEFGQHLPSRGRRLPLLADPQHRATLDDGFVKQSLCRRHRHQRADFAAPAGFAEDRYIVRIATEIRDIVTYPLKRQNQIELADITNRVLLGSGLRDRGTRIH